MGWRFDITLQECENAPKWQFWYFCAQCVQFFIRAHFCKNPGKIRAKIRAKLKFLWVCRLFVISVRSACEFAVWQTAQYRTECALNHKSPGKITKIWALSRWVSPNARIHGYARIYPGDLGTLYNSMSRFGSSCSPRIEPLGFPIFGSFETFWHLG